MSETKCCGNCKHLISECLDGVGWCKEQSWLTRSEKTCNCFEQNLNGWTEITHDNKNELTEELFHRIVIGFVDKHGRMYAMTFLDCRLGIGEMANLGGYYYYVLPELKIE